MAHLTCKGRSFLIGKFFIALILTVIIAFYDGGTGASNFGTTVAVPEQRQHQVSRPFVYTKKAHKGRNGAKKVISGAVYTASPRGSKSR